MPACLPPSPVAYGITILDRGTSYGGKVYVAALPPSKHPNLHLPSWTLSLHQSACTLTLHVVFQAVSSQSRSTSCQGNGCQAGTAQRRAPTSIAVVVGVLAVSCYPAILLP